MRFANPRKKTDALVTHLFTLRPDEIAAFLAEQGITGRPKSSTSCPITMYLKDRVGSPRVEFFVANYVTIVCKERKVYRRSILGSSVLEFVTRFDEGTYPELVRNENV